MPKEFSSEFYNDAEENPEEEIINSFLLISTHLLDDNKTEISNLIGRVINISTLVKENVVSYSLTCSAILEDIILFYRKYVNELNLGNTTPECKFVFTIKDEMIKFPSDRVEKSVRPVSFHIDDVKITTEPALYTIQFVHERELGSDL